MRRQVHLEQLSIVFYVLDVYKCVCIHITHTCLICVIVFVGTQEIESFFQTKKRKSERGREIDRQTEEWSSKDDHQCKCFFSLFEGRERGRTAYADTHAHTPHTLHFMWCVRVCAWGWNTTPLYLTASFFFEQRERERDGSFDVCVSACVSVQAVAVRVRICLVFFLFAVLRYVVLVHARNNRFFLLFFLLS